MKKIRFNLLLAVIFIMTVGICMNTHAASVIFANITPETTYRYDITSDGKADDIKVRYGVKRSGAYAYYYVYVNGTMAYSEQEYYDDLLVKYIRLKNGQTYIYITAYICGDEIAASKLLRYSNGRLMCAFDLENLDRSNYGHVSIGKVKNNSLIIDFFHPHSSTVGSSYMEYTYNYKNGVFVPSSETGYIYINKMGANKATKSTKLISNQKIVAYKNALGTKKAFTIKKGKSVTVDRVFFHDGRIYSYRVKYALKTGWIKALTSYPLQDSQRLFKGLSMAG